MKLLLPSNLQELITKPGAIVTMLKAIMNALKLRWPAFIGTNVIWSVAIFREFSPYNSHILPSEIFLSGMGKVHMRKC